MSVERPDLLVIGLDPAGLALALGMAAAQRSVVLVTQGGEPTGQGGQNALVRLRALGARVIAGEARFRGPQTVSAEGQVLSARRIALALPARPASPAVGGLEAAPRWKPGAPATRVLVLGGDHRAPALAATARREGHGAVLVSPAGLLSGFDSEATSALADHLRRSGIEVHENVAFETARVVPCPEGFLFHPAGGAPIGFSHWCDAAEAAPDFSTLDLEAAGVALAGGRVRCPAGLASDNAAVLALGASRSVHADPALAEAEAGIALTQVLMRLESSRALTRLPRLAHGPLQLIEAGETESALARHAREGLRHYRVPLAGGGFLKAITDRRGRTLRFVVLAANAAGLAPLLSQFLADGRDIAALARLPLPALDQAEALAALGRQALLERLSSPWGGWMLRLTRLFG